ncbi:MAG: methylmalonyl-CoA mutase family protein, partial [Acidiferrobacterales bacterium]
PLNNIARVTVQAIAALFGSPQSLHTDAYDEVFSTPNEEAARVAVNTQNIVRDEAHLADVIDPLGGSYYVESLTNAMEEEIEALIAKVDAVGGMYKAVEAGLVQAQIGESALAFQEQVENGQQTIVGVNAYQIEESTVEQQAPLQRPDLEAINAQLARLHAYKVARDRGKVETVLDQLAQAVNSSDRNVFESVVEATAGGATHGEIVACLRRELGTGQPLVMV